MRKSAMMALKKDGDVSIQLSSHNQKDQKGRLSRVQRKEIETAFSKLKEGFQTESKTFEGLMHLLSYLHEDNREVASRVIQRVS